MAARPLPPLPNVPAAAQLILRDGVAPPPDTPAVHVSRAEYREIAERMGLFISDGETRLGIVAENNPDFVAAVQAHVAARNARRAAEEAKRAAEQKGEAARPPSPVIDEQRQAVIHPSGQAHPPVPPPVPPVQQQEVPPVPPVQQPVVPLVSGARRSEPASKRKRRVSRLSPRPKKRKNRADRPARRAVAPSKGNEPPKKGAAPPDFDEEVPDDEALALKHRVVLCENCDVYFEKQVLKQCYKHATNNLLGGEVVTVDDLDAEARVLAARALKLAPGTAEPVRCAWYDVYDGLYSTSVIHNALAKKGYRLVRVRHEDYQRIPDMPSGKFLVAIEYGVKDAQGHWMNHVIAVDCDRRLVLDSQGNKPLALDRATFARKTGPNARYPRTRIARVHRIVRHPRKASVAPHAS